MTTETTQEARPIAVTPGMLTEALTEFYLTVRDGDRRYKGQVSYPAEVADALHATLSRIAAERGADDEPAKPPAIVCLCGSTRFREEFERAGREETLKGAIVLTVNDFDAYGGPVRGQQDVPADERAAADELHRRKIDLADSVLVVSDESGYFGQSTRGEIRYAVDHGKPVRFAVAASEARAREMGLVP